MGVVRIQAIGPGAVEYLLHGCDPREPEAGQELEAGQEPGGPEVGADRELGREAGAARESGVGYFLDERGEPAGVWLGSGMESLGLSYRAGETARENDLRAIFGELRYPGSQWEGSSQENPVYLGAKPRAYRTLAERVEAALKAEPNASPERQREIDVATARNSRSNTAYYDVTFSPVKSVSVYYAALVAAGETGLAQQVRQAHDRAVRIAIESAQDQVAWAKTGRHGRASGSGRTTGRWEQAQGLSAVLFAHHTNRDGEPQLHAHVGVLNRVGLADGRVYALDGAAFRPVKDAMAAAYDRALEAILSDLTGVVWVERPDGLGREIAGIDPELMEEASTRSRAHVEPRIEELVVAYRERHGYDPGPVARRKIVDQAVKDTRRPKTGPAGPAAVKAWIEREDGRSERLTAALDEVDHAVEAAAYAGHEPMATGHVVGGELASGPELAAGGQTPVAGGQTPVAGGQTSVAGAQTSVAGAQTPVAGGRQVSDEVRAAMGERAVAAGLERVQARYPSWSIGALAREIDHALGPDAGAVGLGIDARREWVWGLAQAAVAPVAGGPVVQVSMGDPVPVPPELRREVDGRSMLRAPIDERYVTASHLSLEEQLAVTAQAPTARCLGAETVGRIADEARRAGLSEDQVAAVAAILASPRQVAVLVGPAGAGKSHTLAQLARSWQAEHGGRVIGTAAAEVATRNLRELGQAAGAGAGEATRNLAELGFQAVNIARLVTALEPDEQGRVGLTLAPNDLLVIDEAGMINTADLDRLTGHAARAGAKVIWSGDHHQLPAVGAGGMFAYLAEKPGALELEQVHRFSAQWEREASLRLRVGDASVATVYANEGRLRAGTLEQMEYFATRDYVADRLAGFSGLLIVGSNQRAEQLSRDIQSQLTELGLIGTHNLAKLRDRTDLRMGDRIQARRGSAQLQVDAPVAEHGRRGTAMPVANRQVFTVVGFDPSTGTVYARDDHGAVAHLTKEYVESQVTLAYAVTNHAAQGVTVDRARSLIERGTGAEALYPAATRGRHLNILYLVTEIDPDPHAPQRERDTAISALVQVLENNGGELTDAALTVQEAAELEARSMLTLTEHYNRIATEQSHTRHAALAVAQLGAEVASESAFPALLGRMRAVELEGHDITAIFARAKAMQGLSDAREVSKVMWWRLGVLQEQRTPEYSREQVIEGRRSVRPAWEQLAEQHHARAAQTGDALESYLATVAEYAGQRTAALGVEVAAAPPAWALEWLGPLPDPSADPAGHAEWVRGAGQVAAYREWRGIPEDQISIGQAPPPAQQLAHELWWRAADTGGGDPRVVDWRKASDAELREALARWEREQQAGPVSVANERGEAIALAHDATNEATVGRARLAAMSIDDPARADLLRRIDMQEVMAEGFVAFVAGLDGAHAAREAWWEQTRDIREAAQGAEHELARRGLTDPEGTVPEPEPEPEAQPTPAEPEPRRAGPASEPELAPGGDTALGERVEQRTPRNPQQAFDLDLGRDEQGAEHQRALDELDPDGQMHPEAREAAVRARNFERFSAELRAEHGPRLDPDQQLSDLAHARARELAEPTGQQPKPAERPVGPEPTPGTAEPTPDPQPAPTIEPQEPVGPQETLEARPEVEVTASPRPEPALETDPPHPVVDDTEQPAVRQQPEGEIDRGRVAEAEPGVEVESGPEVNPRTEVEPTIAADRETGTEVEVGPEVGAGPEVEDGTARLQRVAREVRLARIEREAAAEAEQARDTAPEQGVETSKGAVAEFDREATLDDELAAHRRPHQAEQQAQLELERERDRDEGLELDD